MPEIKREQLEYPEQPLNIMPVATQASYNRQETPQTGVKPIVYGGIDQENLETTYGARESSPTAKRPFSYIDDTVQQESPAASNKRRGSRGKTVTRNKREQSSSGAGSLPSPAPKRPRVSSPQVSVSEGQPPYISPDDDSHTSRPLKTIIHTVRQVSPGHPPESFYMGIKLGDSNPRGRTHMQFDEPSLLEIVKALKTNIRTFRDSPSVAVWQDLLGALAAVQKNLQWLYRVRAALPLWLEDLQAFGHYHCVRELHCCKMVLQIQQIVHEWERLHNAADRLRVVQPAHLVTLSLFRLD